MCEPKKPAPPVRSTRLFFQNVALWSVSMGVCIGIEGATSDVSNMNALHGITCTSRVKVADAFT